MTTILRTALRYFCVAILVGYAGIMLVGLVAHHGVIALAVIAVFIAAVVGAFLL